MENQRPKVGVAVLVFKGGAILLGKRKASIGRDQYGSPGGHLEHLEGFEECARREVLEEAGIEIDRPRFLCVMNNQVHAPHHYVMVVLAADWKSGEPQNMEPDKCEGWDWYGLDALPASMTPAMYTAVEAYRSGRAYFDSHRALASI
ncbi:NUDIX domain-containing protein [Candidatus Uhrbacteria bacterium]|nr:NUDIX domain-containing protein [Candidatus Uhrbacteria bacterium]